MGEDLAPGGPNLLCDVGKSGFIDVAQCEVGTAARAHECELSTDAAACAGDGHYAAGEVRSIEGSGHARTLWVQGRRALMCQRQDMGRSLSRRDNGE
ncbi:hypothetical protein ACQP1G_30120 [Nocardia sp. CA-107356]|uniref:hypothetical protein n=1 Tax=Nocardia sp. CA-107356 TaxID=3239972 RepID=UPI003D8D8A60